jgi:predicted amino acid-binding ACT domain protein
MLKGCGSIALTNLHFSNTMKFISGIRTFESKNGRIEVSLEHYHRASIGLLSGTQIYVYPRKTEHELPKSKRKVDIREVIISLFSPQNWTHIWKLEISAIDRPGLTRKITKILKDLEVNIFIQESLIANYEQDFTVSIIADFGKYFERFVVKDRKVKEIPNAELWDGIKNKFSVEDNEEDFGITIQKFEPIKFLTNISENEVVNGISENEIVDGARSSNRKNQIEYDALVNFYRNPRPIPVKKTGIGLERYLLTALDLSDWINIDLDTIQGTIFSDTEEKYIIIRFFDPKLLVAHLEIIHGNHVGAIHEFTEAIHDIHPEYNIISSYNRIEDDAHFAHWHVLIDVTSNPTSLSALIDKINAIATIPHIEVRPIDYSKQLLETINNLPPTVKQKKEGKSQKSPTTNVAIITENRDEEIRVLRESVNLSLSKSEKEELLQEKKKSLDTLKSLRNTLSLDIERKVTRTKFIFCVLLIICFFIPILCIYLFTLTVMEPWVWVISVVPILLGYLYSSIRSASFNPQRYLEKYRDDYKRKKYTENQFEEEEINTLVEEIKVIQGEIDSIKRMMKQPSR